jgi:hypothetical protein
MDCVVIAYHMEWTTKSASGSKQAAQEAAAKVS